MSKIVLNQCYSDSFDISDAAKNFMRVHFNVIFDPNLTPRNDPALIETVEFYGLGACIYYLDDKGNIIYLSKPTVCILPTSKPYSIRSESGFEWIEILNTGLKRKYSEPEIESICKKLR